jgi:hypothetical protein
VTWIIIRHPIMFSIATDIHQIFPPAVPPTPPKAPAWPYVATYLPIVGELVLGKYTDGVEFGQFMGICLWQHDWGFLQPHATVPVNAWMALLLPGTNRKVQFPAGKVEMQQTGGALAPPGKSSKAAPALPIGLMICQSCQDIEGYAFVLPKGIIFCLPSTVLLGVTVGDLLAFFLAMLGDALRNLALSALGNKLLPSSIGGNTASGLIALAAQLGWAYGSGQVDAPGPNASALDWVGYFLQTGQTPADTGAAAVAGTGEPIEGLPITPPSIGGPPPIPIPGITSPLPPM